MYLGTKCFQISSTEAPKVWLLHKTTFGRAFGSSRHIINTLICTNHPPGPVLVSTHGKATKSFFLYCQQTLAFCVTSKVIYGRSSEMQTRVRTYTQWPKLSSQNGKRCFICKKISIFKIGIISKRVMQII